MIIVVGLGNPDKKHENNRHNVGFKVVDSLANKKWSKNKMGHFEFTPYSSDVALIKPQTFMNDSGKAVSYVVEKYKAKWDNLYVVHDDLDLTLGEYKIQMGKGPKQHNGLLSIYDSLRTSDFVHVRVGVDNRDPENRVPGESYVLQDFTKDEEEVVEKVVVQIVKQLKNEISKVSHSA